MKYIIIGGVAGGATAATRTRRNDESAEIILLEKGKYISYANCGLPYYIGGVIDEREKLFLQTPQSFGTRFSVDVRVENEAIKISPQTKSLKIRKSDGTEYTEQYDKLLLSPGAKPVRPNMEGIDLDGIFVLRDVNDTDKIKNYIDNKNIKNAVVVGAGFIGLEMAENLHHTGAHISIVEMGSHVMAPIDYSMAAQVHQHLLQKGVSLYLEQAVERFSKDGEQISVQLQSGEALRADIVILSIGVRPEVTLPQKAGLRIGETGGIWVDEYLETSEKDIYAVGDAIEFPHPLTGKPWLNYLANPANRQGWIAANNIVFGNKEKYEGAIGTSIAKVFDLTVASTGLAAKRLKQMNIPYRSSWTHSNSHAGYYPDALPLSLKLVFDPANGKLYGAQCVGYNGADKRIDQIALLIKNSGTIYDLMKLEHTYAPPFSSAKDPIAIAGYVAANILSGTMPYVTWRELHDANPSEILVLDVRTKDEFLMEHISGAINIPLDDLRERINEIPKDKTIYIYCAIGLRGYLAIKILLASGYSNAKNVLGGYKTYWAATAPICNNPIEKNPMIEQNKNTPTKTLKVDACGLQCPGPILRLKQSIDSISEGERLEIVATDAGFSRDAQAWCNTTGNKMISNTNEKGKYTVVIEKSVPQREQKANLSGGHGKTFIMFSDDLDKALATFVLANGAAATGEKVSVFFTFWGLNVIKKTKKTKVQKDIFGRMFGLMLPSSSLKLKLSKMHMFGIGSRMMRHKKRG
ncbi:pyridine nucleotide-disulfide oxidoreductase [Bacteroidia bacterium]|nr:pyridine nucleotide-disulfide oxidoreductase [Bacteroidia bacterium]